jgi:hypothetical protein
MRTVYRVEHTLTGIGPYQHSPDPCHFDYNNEFWEEYENDYADLRSEMESAHSDNDHPVLSAEGCVSAFDSLFALNSWFYDFMDWLTHLDFIIVEMEVTEIWAKDKTGQVLIRTENIVTKRGVA